MTRDMADSTAASTPTTEPITSAMPAVASVWAADTA